MGSSYTQNHSLKMRMLRKKNLFYLTTDMFIRVSGKTMKEMVEGFKYGKMGQFTKVIGRITWLMDLEGLYIQMEMCILDNGSSTEQMAKENIYQTTERNIMEIGKMISRMDLERKSGRMGPFTKDSM